MVNGSMQCQSCKHARNKERNNGRFGRLVHVPVHDDVLPDLDHQFCRMRKPKPAAGLSMAPEEFRNVKSISVF